MKSTIKIIALMVMSFLALVGTAFAASSIKVEDLNIQKADGDYTVLVSLNNENPQETVFTELTFRIEELNKNKSVGAIKVDGSETKVFTYSLSEAVDTNLLEKGSTYRITASTDADSMTETFLYGAEKSSEGLNIVVEGIKVDGNEITNLDSLQVISGETISVEFRFEALKTLDDVRIRASIDGYEHADITTSTSIFAVKAGKTYVKTMDLQLPVDMDSKKEYKLRITGANDLSGLTYKEYTLYVDTQRHKVDVIDFITTPSSGVEPGENMIANVRLKNRGQKDQDSVKVSVEIPELNVIESTYLSNVKADEVITSDDMLIYIPETAEAKLYDAKVSLTYNDGYTTTEEMFALNVLSPKAVEEKNLLVSFKNNIDLTAGEEDTIEIVIANPNSESKPISLVSAENTWANVDITPSLAMIKSGEEKTFTLKVTPKNAIEGVNELKIAIKEGADEVSEISIQTYVEPTKTNWVNVALGALLVIAIVVLLALIVTIISRKKSEDEEIGENSNEEYY